MLEFVTFAVSSVLTTVPKTLCKYVLLIELISLAVKPSVNCSLLFLSTPTSRTFSLNFI